MKSFRHKRQANDDALALNDRLKEKIQHVFEEQQSKVENMTCVLREMNCLNAENEIDIRAMKKDAEQYSMESLKVLRVLVITMTTKQPKLNLPLLLVIWLKACTGYIKTKKTYIIIRDEMPRISLEGSKMPLLAVIYICLFVCVSVCLCECL